MPTKNERREFKNSDISSPMTTCLNFKRFVKTGKRLKKQVEFREVDYT